MRSNSPQPKISHGFYDRFLGSNPVQTLFRMVLLSLPSPPLLDLAVVVHMIVKSVKCTAGAFSCRRLPMVDLVQSASLQTYTPTTAHRRPPYSGRPAAAALRTFREGRWPRCLPPWLCACLLCVFRTFRRSKVSAFHFATVRSTEIDEMSNGSPVIIRSFTCLWSRGPRDGWIFIWLVTATHSKRYLFFQAFPNLSFVNSFRKDTFFRFEE